MPKFLHTADWQIGKPYNRIENVEKRARLKRVRIEAVTKLMDLAKEKECSFVLVAGDLFDSPTPTLTDIREVLSIIGQFDIPVYAIPGNHDFGGNGSFWTHKSFVDANQELASNFHILLEPEPIELDEAVIFPCPLKKRHEKADLIAWIDGVEMETFGNKARIVLAHGSVQTFQSDDFSDSEEDLVSTNHLDFERINLEDLDYIALGDWHGLKQINDKAYYSGTPEIDRFPKGESNQPGYILIIDANRGSKPVVESYLSSSANWHVIEKRIEGKADLNSLESELIELKGGRVNQDLIQLRLSGFLSLEEFEYYRSLKLKLEADLLRLKLYENIDLKPSNEEMEGLKESDEHPLISSVAQHLFKNLEDEASRDRDVYATALRELYMSAQN